MIGILNEFFIFIGDLALSLVDLLTFKCIELEKDSEIFKKLNLDTQKSKKPETRLDELRDHLLEYMLTKAAIGLVLIIAMTLLIFTDLELSGMFLTMAAMAYMFIFYYPTIKEQRSYSDLNQELPYALRHMGIELKSGKGLHDALLSIKNSD